MCVARYLPSPGRRLLARRPSHAGIEIQVDELLLFSLHEREKRLESILHGRHSGELLQVGDDRIADLNQSLGEGGV